jgi:ribosomal protein S7
MGHENRSFEATAAAAAAADDAAPHHHQQLSASDRQLLEKLVGIMTKDGKKSRARRLLLDAMHIIKQQVAKGQQVA